MNTPAAAPSGPGFQSDILPGSSNTVTWISFGGAPGESSSAFAQSIQRVAFEQGRSRDDAWMADYAGACFEGDALGWYATLEDDVQESWKSLRRQLFVRYPPVAAQTVPYNVPSAPNVTSSRASGVPAPPSAPQQRVGVVEALDKQSSSRGFLVVESNGTIGLTVEKTAATILSFPRLKGSEILQLTMTDPLRDSFSCLGIALHLPKTSDQNKVPIKLAGIYRVGVPTNSFIGGLLVPPKYGGVPEPSSVCDFQPSAYDESRVDYKRRLATWRPIACGKSDEGALYRRRARAEDPSIRASAAVWKYDEGRGELSIFWLMDDDTECELGGYVHKGSSKDLHMHRISDVGIDKFGLFIQDERVRFAFVPN